MQRIAIIDIGSNSARLVITHIYKNGAYNMVYNQKEALRLSQKIDKNGNLTQQAFSDTIETMKSFAYMCKLVPRRQDYCRGNGSHPQCGQRCGAYAPRAA